VILRHYLFTFSPSSTRAADGFGAIQFHVLAVQSSTDRISYSVHCGFGLDHKRFGHARRDLGRLGVCDLVALPKKKPPPG
jgi:hypothetical protein